MSISQILHWLSQWATRLTILGALCDVQLKESLPQEIKFNPEDFKGSDVEPGPDRAKRNQEVASIYNNVWKTGDAGPADDILAEDTHQVSVAKPRNLSRFLAQHSTESLGGVTSHCYAVDMEVRLLYILQYVYTGIVSSKYYVRGLQ